MKHNGRWTVQRRYGRLLIVQFHSAGHTWGEMAEVLFCVLLSLLLVRCIGFCLGVSNLQDRLRMGTDNFLTVPNEGCPAINAVDRISGYCTESYYLTMS